VLAGPNGSGKSSFTQQVRDGTRTIDCTIPPVINPDVIAKRMNPADPDSVSLAAGREALVARPRSRAARVLLSKRRSREAPR
jgi:predicted ABC-type ATPase